MKKKDIKRAKDWLLKDNIKTYFDILHNKQYDTNNISKKDLIPDYVIEYIFETSKNVEIPPIQKEKIEELKKFIK